MGEWLSYQDAGERLGISGEAVRQRAMRGHWPRRRSNEGVALVQIPEGVVVRSRTPVEHQDERPAHTPPEHPLERLVSALESHIDTLRFDIERARAELAEERQAMAAMRDDYRRLVQELFELKKTSAVAPPPPRSAPKRSAPRPAPASSDGTPEGYLSNTDSIAEVLARLKARQAERERLEAEEDAQAATAH